jgi:hypothetical protein
LRERLCHADFRLDGEAPLPELSQAVDSILIKMRQFSRTLARPIDQNQTLAGKLAR